MAGLGAAKRGGAKSVEPPAKNVRFFSGKNVDNVLHLSHAIRDNCNRKTMKQDIRMTNAEWEVMMVSWQRAPVAASAVLEQRHASRRWSLAAVRSLLQRMVNKGALARQIEGKRF